MEYPLEKVQKVLKIMRELISLETPIGEEGDSHLVALIEDKKTMSPSKATISMDMAEQIRSSRRPRQRERKRFFVCFSGSPSAEIIGRKDPGNLWISARKGRDRSNRAAARKLRNPSQQHILKPLLK